NAWSTALTQSLSPLQAAQEFVQSGEYESNLITRYYQTLLGRNPDSSGSSGWLGAMQRGLTEQQVLADLLISDEYYANHGGTNAGWVTGLYHNLLNRDPDAPGLNLWLQDMQNGLSRAAVAAGIENSQEAFTLDVSNAYHNILGRSANAT